MDLFCRGQKLFDHTSHNRFYAALASFGIPFSSEISNQTIERKIPDSIIPKSNDTIPVARATEGIVEIRRAF
jgi:hypothetical protein